MTYIEFVEKFNNIREKLDGDDFTIVQAIAKLFNRMENRDNAITPDFVISDLKPSLKNAKNKSGDNSRKYAHKVGNGFF